MKFLCVCLMSIIYRQTDHTLQQHSNCTEDMDVSVCIEPGHLFRYKKEVNPKNKKSKVSNYSLNLYLPGPGIARLAICKNK